MKKIFFILIIYIICGIVACSSQKENKAENKEKFLVTTPITIDTTITQEYVADIQAVQNVEIRAKVNGFIEKIHIDEGQTVQAGQLLFTISSPQLKEELQRAEAQLRSVIAEAKLVEVELKNTKILVEKNVANSQLKTAIAEAKVAEVELRNTKTLVDKKIVSASELEMAEAKVAAAQAKVQEAESAIGIVSNTELEMAKAKLAATQAKIEEAESAIATAKLNLALTSIKAPFSGIINRIPLKIGSLVAEGELLTSISNNKEVFAYFNVSEKEYLDFVKEKGQNQSKEVSLILADGQPFPHKGIVETVESEIDKATGNLAFRARFANADLLLKHGASGKIQLLHKVENAMIIPQKSTFEIQENTFVYVVDKEGLVQSKAIEIKQRIPHFYVIAGLSPEDTILYEGLQTVREGSKIAYQMQEMRDIMSEISKR